MTGSCHEIYLKLLQTASGYIEVSYAMTNITFEAQWANPLWEALESDKNHERAQVLHELRTIKQMIPARKGYWSAAQVAAVAPTELWLRGDASRLIRAWRTWSMGTLALMGLNSLRGWGAVLLMMQATSFSCFVVPARPESALLLARGCC